MRSVSLSCLPFWEWGANGGEFASDSLRNSTYTFLKDKNDKNEWSVGNADITMPDIKLKKQ